MEKENGKNVQENLNVAKKLNLLNFTFHNILIYNRATFNNRVACCVNFVGEYRQPVRAIVVARSSVK